MSELHTEGIISAVELPGKIINADTVQLKLSLPGSIDTVWSYLTKPEELADWLGYGEFSLKPGGRIGIDFSKTNYQGHIDGHWHIRGTIDRCDPPHALSYSWIEPDKGITSYVSFALVQSGADVELTIVHSSLAPDLMAAVAAGWQTHVEVLIARLAGKQPASFKERHDYLLKQYLLAVSAAGILITQAAPAATASGADDSYRALQDQRQQWLVKYDYVWKQADKLEREVDSLKKTHTAEVDRALDDLDRDLKDKYADLKELELNIRDIDRSLTEMKIR